MKRRTIFPAVLAVLFLSACGGGGDDYAAKLRGDTAQAAPAPAPTVAPVPTAQPIPTQPPPPINPEPVQVLAPMPTQPPPPPQATPAPVYVQPNMPNVEPYPVPSDGCHQDAKGIWWCT
jgi:hypothetical protein